MIQELFSFSILSFLFLILINFIAISTGLLFFRRETYIPQWLKLCGSAGIGFVIISVMVFIAGAAGLLYVNVLKAGMLVLFVLSAYFFIKYGDDTRRYCSDIICKLKNSYFLIASLIIFLLFIFALFLICLLPPAVRDELVYHLTAPKLYLKHHRIFHIEGNIFAAFPSFTEMLYLIPLALNMEQGARLLHLNFTLFSAVTLYFLARKYLSIGFSTLSSFFFITSPVVFSIAGIAYIDIALVFYSLLSFAFFMHWLKKRESISFLIYIGMFSGAAMAIKYTGIWIFLIMLLLILFSFLGKSDYLVRRKEGLDIIKKLTIFSMASLAVASPWYIKNYIFTRNPIYPFFYEIFGGKGWDSFRESLYMYGASRFFTGDRILDYFLFPLSFPYGMNPQVPGYFGFDGIPGILLTFTLPAVIFLALNKELIKKVKYLLLFFIIYSFIWVSTSTQTRLFLPALPITIIMIMISAQKISEQSKILKFLFLMFISCSIVFNLYHNIRFLIDSEVKGYLSGEITREQYLENKLPGTYPAIEFINHELEPSAKIWLIWMKNQGYYLERDYYSDSFYEAATAELFLGNDSSMKGLKSFLAEKHISHILIDEKLFLAVTPFDSYEEKERKSQMRYNFSIFSKTFLDILWQRDGITLYKMRM